MHLDPNLQYFLVKMFLHGLGCLLGQPLQKPVSTNSFRVLKSALWAILAESSVLVEAFDNHFGNGITIFPS